MERKELQRKKIKAPLLKVETLQRQAKSLLQFNLPSAIHFIYHRGVTRTWHDKVSQETGTVETSKFYKECMGSLLKDSISLNIDELQNSTATLRLRTSVKRSPC